VRNLLWRSGQLLMLLLPFALMTLAGAMYLWQVKLALEDALPPALREYARRQAQLDVQVERIALSLRGALLTNADVRTLTGERLFRARYLEARLPREGEPLTIEIDRPEVWLQRNRQGIWNIDPLLKQPRPPEPTPITIRVRAREGTLYFDDFLPDMPVRATLWAEEFTLSQPRIGQQITLRGISDALGAVEARALSDGKRWLVEVRANQARGDAFKPYLTRTDLDVQQARGQVALQLVYEPDQPLQVHGVAKGIAQSATFRQKPIPYREFEWQAAFSETGLTGELKTRDRRLQAHGMVDWSGKKPFITVQASVLGNDAATLWRLFRTDEPIPQGRYDIQVRLEGAPDSVQAIGVARLERIRTPQGDLSNLRAEGLFKEGQLHLPKLEAEYAGRTIRGKLWLNTNPNTSELRLYATVKDLPLHSVPALREQELRGEVDAQIVAHGKLDNPRIEANLLSDALFYKQRRLGGARARVEYADGTLHVPLAVLQGAAGLVQVSGEILNLLDDNPRFDLQIDANELDLNLLAQLAGYTDGELLTDGEGNALRLEGVGYLTAQLRGSLKSPEAVAEAVVFDGRLGDIGAEITVANLNLLERELRITQLQILRRASQLLASGIVSLPAQSGEQPRFQLQGDLFEFDLASIPDWLRREFPLSGLASGAFEAEGSPEKFTVRAALNSEGVQYDQTLLQDTQARLVVQVENGVTQVEVASAQARLGEGTLIARGRWRPENDFEAFVRLENASLEVLAPYLPPEYRLAGQASLEGVALGTLDAPRASVKVESKQIALNGALLGDVEGVVEFSPHRRNEDSNKTLYAQLTLRTPDGEARITQLQYDTDNETLLLDAETDPIPIDWLRRVARAVPDAMPPAVAERIETLQGRVQAQLQVEGALREPAARLTLNAETLEWRGQSLGNLALQGVWQGKSEVADLAEASPAERAAESIRRLRTQRAELQRLRWQAENTRLEAQGTYTPERLDADIEIAQLPLRWARLWEPSLPEFDGNLDLSLLADGNPESPELTLSATVSNLIYGEYTVDQVLFSQINVREGAVQTDDALIRMGDYQARLSGRLPFHWSPLSIPDNEPIQIQARLREQPLTLLSLFAPIDKERTQGVIEGFLEVNGTLAEPQPRGRLTITNGAIALQDLRTALQEIGLQVEFDGREARIVQAQARSSEGGTLRVEGAVDLSGDRPTVNARLVAESFTANEPKLPVLEGSAKAVVSGTMQMEGDLTEPAVRGVLRVQRGFLYLPPEFAPRESGEPLPINPRFDLRVETADDFTLRNPNLDTRMEGNLQVGGSLQSPTLTGEFSLRGGALSLPTARLRIEPDSIARVNYPFTSTTGETIARIELDVRASTSVVAPDFTGDPVRYRVEVDVRGPLDDPERLQMTARSDPPGLSEQRILSLLGRGQALAAIARGADPAQVFREQISDIFTAQVLPGLLAPLETGIAEAFDLEQFSLDYTGLRPASLYLVKNLFDGVGIAYRRSIGVGDQEYQVRFFYRLPFRNRLLQRLRVGVGFDHKQNRFVFIEGSVLFR
jgi:autotransporter translocation and assembly factor TamB